MLDQQRVHLFSGLSGRHRPQCFVASKRSHNLVRRGGGRHFTLGMRMLARVLARLLARTDARTTAQHLVGRSAGPQARQNDNSIDT